MVKYYGRARQRIGSVNTNQLGLKMSGCPSRVGRNPVNARYIKQRVNCMQGTCGPIQIHGVNVPSNKFRNNPPYCKKRSTTCLAAAGGIGNINTPYYRTPAPGEKGCGCNNGPCASNVDGVKQPYQGRRLHLSSTTPVFRRGDSDETWYKNGSFYEKPLSFIQNAFSGAYGEWGSDPDSDLFDSYKSELSKAVDNAADIDPDLVSFYKSALVIPIRNAPNNTFLHLMMFFDMSYDHVDGQPDALPGVYGFTAEDGWVLWDGTLDNLVSAGLHSPKIFYG